MDWSKTAMEGDETLNRKGKSNKNNKKDKKKISDVNYDSDILKRYKKALDNALKVATSFNLSPIKGSTAILLNQGYKMVQTNPSAAGKSAKSLGKSVTSVADIAALLALMFNYSCEYAKLVVFQDCFVSTDIKLDSGTILENMKSLRSSDIQRRQRVDQSNFPRSVLSDFLLDRKVFDNIVVLSQGIENSDLTYMTEFLKSYRSTVNPQLLFVNVNLGVSEANQSVFDHENDVNISGFSDSILRFVAERSDQGQLTFIDNIDKAYDLPPLASEIKSGQALGENALTTIKVDRPRLKLYAPTPEVQWRNLKVFISSTFRDMHSEVNNKTNF
jgi:telomerase protein component 1